MSYQYAILGAGRQGYAAAYDLGKHGQAEKIYLADIAPESLNKEATKLNDLLDSELVEPILLDIADKSELIKLLEKVDGIISSVHFTYNLELTKLALEIGFNMTDLGGNTQVVRDQLSLNSNQARSTVVPDCGMGPGMNVSLATYAMSLVDEPREVFIWDGGLPQNPEPPWNYKSTFNLDGLSNEYYGNAYFIQEGDIREVPCFSKYELLNFPEPLGKLEAFVTSGGLSTAPWSLQHRLKTLENKTLRYPGHHAQFKAFSDLGLLEQSEVEISGCKIKPREFFHHLLKNKIYSPQVEDVGIIRVLCRGISQGEPKQARVELIDYFNPETGLTAMQKLTGWHASIMLILAVQDQLKKGVISVENAVSGEKIVEQLELRGFNLSVKVK
ncbi:MAG: hypothetical protein APR63_14635 [Desulfuromonas sp. SDB]|nr:MAG: hypothetical protein APR63_14635 [Desulfuromonas sp. SDB]